MAGAEIAKPAGKIDDIAENQEQNTDKPDDQPRLKSKEDAQCENQTCRNRNTTKRIINEPKY